MNNLLLASLLALPAAAANHPLEPLDSAEMQKAVDVLKAEGKLAEGVKFPSLALNEPPKAEVLAWKMGHPSRREAFAVLYDGKASKTYEAVVDLKAGKVASFLELPGVQPGVLLSEFEPTQERGLLRP